MDVKVNRATWQADRRAIKAVRNEVFVREQAIPAALDFDGADPSCVHALARIDGIAVGTGRLQDGCHIGRIAVRKEYRRMGIGTAIVIALIEASRNAGFTSVYLNSRVSAAGFYERLGFVRVGAAFIEAGIEHFRMELDVRSTNQQLL